jgi:hypothetical protein
MGQRRESLWTLAVPPLIWGAHFLLSYWTAAVWCAKVGGSLSGVRIAVALYTAVALAGLSLSGYRGYRQRGPGVHDADTPESRAEFVGHAAMLLAGLSAIAVLYASLVAVVIRSCT